MNLWKKILLGLAAVIALLLIVALFVPKSYTIEREVVIAKPRQEVFNYVKSLRNQAIWSTWALTDPDILQEYRGTDGEIGSVYAWKSKKVGVGEQEIKKLSNGERIDIEMRFLKPFASVSPVFFTTESLSENQTRVRWNMQGRMPYPMNIMRLVMDIDKAIGGEFDKSFVNLKRILENG